MAFVSREDRPSPVTTSRAPTPGLSRYDAVAARYEAARPDYPAEVFEAIREYAGVGSDPRVLEVGSGTGQATRQMAALGWSVDAIEPGGQLIAVSEANAGAGAVRFQHARFEDALIDDGVFDVVIAATSWHWVDPEIGYRKAHHALAANGVIALVWNAHVPDTPHPDWVHIRRAYVEVAPELADLAPFTPDRPDYDPATELQHSGYFESIETRAFAFEISYTTNAFIDLLDTYASHDVLDRLRRNRLYERLRLVIDDDLGGVVIKPYRAVLVLGRRCA